MLRSFMFAVQLFSLIHFNSKAQSEREKREGLGSL